MWFAEFLARGRGCRFASGTHRPRTNPRRRTRPSLEGLEARELLASASQLFVAQAYRDLLHREAEPAGLAFWSGLIDRGISARTSCSESRAAWKPGPGPWRACTVPCWAGRRTPAG